MRIGADREPAAATRRSLPPDFRSRRMQTRLLGAVFAVGIAAAGLQLLVSPSAREEWAKFFRAAETAGAPEADTRLARVPEPEAAPDGLIAMEAPATKPPSLPLADPEGDVVAATRRQGWARLWTNLEADERGLLLGRLRAIDDGVAAPTPAGWTELTADVAAFWRDYLQAAQRAALTDREITPEQQQAWLAGLTRLDPLIEREGAALAAAGSATLPGADDARALDELREVLDAVLLDTIRDDTLFRAAESDAWFRTFERLRRTSAEDLARQSRGVVSHWQLHGEPANYRGSVVTVRGTIRAAHRTRAPRNWLGLEEYYVFWLQPEGATSPIVIYALEPPPGFPEVPPKDARGEMREYREAATFVGSFFKRWAYEAQDGVRTAPLLAARSGTWTPTPTLAARRTTPWSVLGWIVAGLAAAAIAFAAVVYYQTSRPSATARRLRLESPPKFD